MPADRSVRTLIAAVLIVLALLLAINYFVVDRRPVADYWLPLLLLAAGVVIASPLQARLRDEASPPTANATGALDVREYHFEPRPAAPALAAAREEAGEVNVSEPRDEAESQAGAPAPEGALPDTGPAPAPSEAVPDDLPPRPINPPPPPAAAPEQLAEERALDDLSTAGAFAPPASGEGFLNPPATSDEDAPGTAVQPVSGVQREDPARPGMPVTPITEPETPPRSGAERLAEDQAVLQPQDTKETEFQSGEHVAFNQPTESAPPVTQTTGEGMGAGVEPMAPEEKEVLDTTSAPQQPTSQPQIDVTRPDIAEAVLSDTETPETTAGIAPTDSISPRVAADTASPTRADDLTVVLGIGGKMAAALKAAGIDTYTKLAMASDDDIRTAVESAGLRFAPTLSTWRQQATFLARGDRAGFDALVNTLRAQTVQSREDDADQKKTDFIDPGRS